MPGCFPLIDSAIAKLSRPQSSPSLSMVELAFVFMKGQSHLYIDFIFGDIVFKYGRRTYK